jgi:hypothetical protein
MMHLLDKIQRLGAGYLTVVNTEGATLIPYNTKKNDFGNFWPEVKNYLSVYPNATFLLKGKKSINAAPIVSEEIRFSDFEKETPAPAPIAAPYNLDNQKILELATENARLKIEIEYLKKEVEALSEELEDTAAQLEGLEPLAQQSPEPSPLVQAGIDILSKFLDIYAAKNQPPPTPPPSEPGS